MSLTETALAFTAYSTANPVWSNARSTKIAVRETSPRRSRMHVSAKWLGCALRGTGASNAQGEDKVHRSLRAKALSMPPLKPPNKFYRTYTFSSPRFCNTSIVCVETGETYWFEGGPSPAAVYTLSKPLFNESGDLIPGSREVVATMELPLPLANSDVAEAWLTHLGVRHAIWTMFPWHSEASRLAPSPPQTRARWIKDKKLVDDKGRLLAQYDSNQHKLRESGSPTLRISQEGQFLNIELVILGLMIMQWNAEWLKTQ
ncbi:hypothetical protein DL93DRAFT_100297 [Clavulina sp. PMI_390]|nr:hypothetical protein DL93DRAFT_100297 [Clavulina sp. PMI_390]